MWGFSFWSRSWAFARRDGTTCDRSSATGTAAMATYSISWSAGARQRSDAGFEDDSGQRDHPDKQPARGREHYRGRRSTLQVQAHELAYANSDSEAKNIFDSEAAHVSVNGAAVEIESSGNDHGRVNLTVTVPRTAKVTVNSGKGDVTASGWERESR
ncbi:MAG: hypothetical protein WDM87_18305 [Terracidiphilus sp.]